MTTTSHLIPVQTDSGQYCGTTIHGGVFPAQQTAYLEPYVTYSAAITVLYLPRYDVCDVVACYLAYGCPLLCRPPQCQLCVVSIPVQQLHTRKQLLLLLWLPLVLLLCVCHRL